MRSLKKLVPLLCLLFGFIFARPAMAQTGCSSYSISVTPCNTHPNVAANSSLSTVFLIRNFGSSMGVYLSVAAVCNHIGILTCTPTQTNVFVPPGGTVPVTLNYTTGSVGQYAEATLQLRDLSGGGNMLDVLYQPILTQPLSVNLTTYNPNDQDMRRCAVGCFTARYSHSTVPFYTLDQPRTVTVMYHGDRAWPRPVIHVLASMLPGAQTPTEFRMAATINGVNVTFTNGEQLLHFQGGTSGRLSGQFDASAYSTGTYSLTVTVTAVYANGSTTPISASSKIPIVNEGSSAIANGWTLTGIQRMYFTSGGYLITDGDGSATWFQGLGQGADFTTLSLSGSTYTRTYLDGTRTTFNSAGFMNGIIDRFGRTTSIVYDASNRVSQIIDPRRNAGANVPYYQLAYGAYGLASISETGGPGIARTTTFNVGSARRLSSITDPDGISIALGYDGSGRLSTVTNRRGAVKTFVYNSGWKLSQLIEPVVSVDAGGGTTTTATPVISLTPWQTNGVPQGTTAGNPAALLSTSGFTAIVKDPLNRTTTITTDAWGQPTSVNNLAGTTTIARNGHVPTQIVYPDGSVDSLKYDSQERMIMRGTSGNSPTFYHYASVGLIDTVSGASTQKTVRQFDGLGHVTHIAYNGGAYINYYYDAVTQRLQTAVDNAGHAISYSYTNDGNVYQYVASGGRVTTRTVDPHGRTATLQTSSSNVFTTQYDSLNRPVAVYDGTGNAPTRFTYDASFQTDIQDPNGNVTHTDYNALGWPTQQRDPLSQYTTYRYDASGLLTSTTNRRGQIVSMTYDNAGRITSKTGANTTSDYFSYGAGNRSMAAWNAIESDSIYDWSGATAVGDSTVTRVSGQRYRILHGYTPSWTGRDSTVIVANTGVTFRTRYLTIDPITGQVGTYPDGFNTLTYAYNGEQLRYQTTSGVTGSRLENYTSVHQMYATSFSASSLNNLYGRSYSYDVNSRIGEVGKTDSTMRYAYNGIGQLVAANAYSCPANTFTFDSTAGRTKTGCTLQSSLTYSYDATGNRTDHGGGYTAGNRIQQFGSFIFEHDADGNVTRKYNSSTGEDRRFSWSADGLLTDVTLGAQSVHYDYNAFGQPVRRVTNGVVDRYWVYEDDDLLGEFDATASNQRVAEYLYSPGVDVPYGIIVGPTSPTGIWYSQQDEGGNVIGQQANSTSVMTATYDPWGVTRIAGSTNNRLLWKSRMWEGGIVGLYYVRNRWYDPDIGRFMSEDPAGAVDGPNMYVFGKNDPVNGWDPSGLFVGELESVTVDILGDIAGSWIHKKIKRLFHHKRKTAPAVAKRVGPPGGFHEEGIKPTALDPTIFICGAVAGAEAVGEGALEGLAEGASAVEADAGAAVEEVEQTYQNLLEDAQKEYPNKAGRLEKHHVTPKYLGGAPNGPLSTIDAAYHQLITNEFRRVWEYGKGLPNPEELAQIMEKVYSKYPLP